MEQSRNFRSGRRMQMAAFCALFLPMPAFAQQVQQPSPITLPQAVKIALEKNPQRKAALADAKAASAGVTQARSNLLPHLIFSETATAGDDPVYVFGSKLRQRRFTAPDFALNALNTPVPFGDFTTRFGGTWNLFDSLVGWRAVNRAEKVKDAADRQLDRADQEILFHVTDSYYAVLLARKQLDVAEQAMKTAQAILDRSKNRLESGVSVESDYLGAQVRMAARKQELIRAQNNLALARAELGVAMGLSTQDEFEPADDLTERSLPSAPLVELEKKAIESRPDLKRIRAEEAAQQQSVTIAKSSFGPRVNAFAGWELDNPTLFAGGGNNWLAGIELQIDLFQGGAKQAELSRQRAVQEKIAAMRESATDAVRLEIRRAYYDVDATRQQFEVARASIAESQDSLRLIQDRYEAGITTMTDLLAAEEAALRSQTDYWQSLTRYYTGYAALELASGMLNPESPVVTP